MSDDDLHLTVLGSATPYPSADNPCSGYLVSCGDTRLWMDAGTGTLAALQRYARLDEVDAVWISHLHADHSADLLTAYYGLLFADVRLTAPIPLYGPPGIADRLAHFLTNSAERSPVESAFAVHELHDGHRTRVGGLTLTTRAVEHGVPAFAVRVETARASLVYSGDTAPCSNLTSLARDCDVLLCEAESATVPVDGPVVHHTGEDAGATASAARARGLIVTHVGRFSTAEHAVARAATAYDGPITCAAPGAVFSIGTRNDDPLPPPPVAIMTETSSLTAIRSSYDTIAADYAERFGDDLADKPLERALLAGFAELVRDVGPVADLGCGPGHVTAHLHDLGLPVFGVDLSPGMVAQARRARPGLRFDVGSMTALDLPDGALGGVVAWYSIIHLSPEELSAAVAEFHRVLAPGGHVLLAFQLWGEAVRLEEWFGHEVSLDLHPRSPEEVAALLEEAGFVPVARLLREPGAGEKVPRAHLLARRS
ncbi:methyltransferase domain-containing protein [Umezawaea beigongshangensis]|uniref:methyltransferase domain-containing protein n=1 Tax=Umezawaea beigongshangensis TaxID=2780383 RepID=UPI0027DD3527|nr:methyltransferase domain-containing protein [Umezawaea beigongshangensis]